jgi:hypothetical protein
MEKKIVEQTLGGGKTKYMSLQGLIMLTYDEPRGVVEFKKKTKKNNNLTDADRLRRQFSTTISQQHLGNLKTFTVKSAGLPRHPRTRTTLKFVASSCLGLRSGFARLPDWPSCNLCRVHDAYMRR